MSLRYMHMQKGPFYGELSSHVRRKLFFYLQGIVAGLSG
jgi:hypothetical protein